jgi:choline dehydrogenase-like flavoprotein
MTVLAWRDYRKHARFDADVVVVGTGAGGAAAGTVLAEAGLSVLFVEEGGYHPTPSFTPSMTHSLPRLYRDIAASFALGSPPIAYAEGRCVGGSTVINGGMAYRAPERVLDRWQRATGDPGLGPAGMAPLFEEVEARIHAAPQLDLSIGDDNRIMAAGARKLGWRYSVNRRSQATCVGSNNCVLGCPTGAKQSVLVSYLPHAFAHRADCLTDVRVERLLIEGGRAVGVAGRAFNPLTRQLDLPVEARGRAVVVAAGAVQTPYLLLRHRVGRPSGQLGRNLLLHPNTKMCAIYPFEVRGWEGVSQWCQIREFHDEGIVLAENFVPPGVLAAHVPNHGRAVWELMRAYPRMIHSGVLVEDSTSGTVRRGPRGLPLARYDITELDYQRFKKGVRALSELHFAMGAELLVMPFARDHFARSMDEVDRILARQRRHKDLDLFTVHVMGTARMGNDRRGSVIDLNGEVWDLPGCYVADASVFPTAIAVNPQVTIMALATRLARRLADRLGARPRRRPAAPRGGLGEAAVP